MKSTIVQFVMIFMFYPLLLQAQITIGPIDDSYIFRAGENAYLIYGVLKPNVLITRESVKSETFSRDAYIMFDIVDQPGPFRSAVIQLYGNVVEAKNVEVCYSDTTWSEETLTGNNRPAGTYISTTSLAAGEGYSTWEVTQYVNMARSAGAHKLSFVFKDAAGDDSTADTDWHSKENSSGNAPKLVLIPGDPPEVYTSSYYIDQINGNDENSGQDPSEAWKSLANIETLLLKPGDSLLFKSGDVWTGTFSPKGSGLPGKPVVIGKYGGEERPVIHGAGMDVNTISLSNQHHIELRDLAITNLGAVEEFRRAVFYTASDLGEIRYIVFDNLEVYDVNGIIDEEINRYAKNNGGIFFEITGSSIPTWFDTLVISNCHIHDVNRTGISNTSSWDGRTLHVNENWVPSKNVHIHHNTFERTGANALIVRVAHRPLMEYNLFDHCSILWTGNASFSFNTDSAIWQYNEARFTKYNPGDNDAGGFDSDFRAKHTIIQYNYSHDNGYGGILLTGGKGTGSGFNDGTIVRYNVFANNAHHNFRTSGNLTNSKIYNNVIYTGPELEGVMQVWHKSWGGGLSDSTFYWNNIFFNEGTNTSLELTESTNNEFRNNIFYGNPIEGQSLDPVGITEDPKLLDPGGDATGFEAVLQYAITAGSSAIDMGMSIEGSVTSDIIGNIIPSGNASDIGAFEWLGDTVDLLVIVKDENMTLLEGADIWVEGYGTSSTDVNGETLLNDLLTGDHIPLTIKYTGYPILAGSLEVNSSDTAIFILSKNTWDLHLVVSDSSGTLLENAEVTIPGVDTLISDANGEVLFTGVTESENVLFRAELDGYHYKYGMHELFKHDTAAISLYPRWVLFEIRNSEQVAMKDVVVSLEGYGSLQTNANGLARFLRVLENDTIEYSVEKSGFVPIADTLIIGISNLGVSASMEMINVYFMVSDTDANPVYQASVVFNDQIKYTNDLGLVEFVEAPLEMYLPYTVYHSGYKTYDDVLLLTKTGDTIYVEMLPLDGYEVGFAITDQASTAIEGAMVTLSGYGIMTTNAMGSAVFENVIPAGSIVYMVSKSGYKDTVNVLTVVDENILVSISLISEAGTAVNPESKISGIELFPNPASDFINIRLPDLKGDLQIYDAKGSLKESRSTDSEFIRIDVAGWEAGVYYISFRNDYHRPAPPVKLVIVNKVY